MILLDTLGHNLNKATFAEPIRAQIEADILSYGCDSSVVEEVCVKALAGDTIDILDILEDTELIDMYQAAELVKCWFGEEVIFTSYHIYLNDKRKTKVHRDLEVLELSELERDVLDLLRKAEIEALFEMLDSNMEPKNRVVLMDKIISWTGDTSYRPRSW
ncbi:MAG: hypothetical protein OCC49_07470 [Fibrobacterales bacterium]